MTQKEKVEHIKKLISKVEVAMMTSVDEKNDLHSRPMMVQEVDDEGYIWFLSGEESSKVSEMKKTQHVNLSFSLADKNKFVSVTGDAKLVKDSQKVKKLWKNSYKLWFPNGPEDPNIVLVGVKMSQAEYWDGPRLGIEKLVLGAKAILAGNDAAPDTEYGKIDLAG